MRCGNIYSGRISYDRSNQHQILPKMWKIDNTQHTVLCSSMFVQVPIATTIAVIVAFFDAQ